METAAINEANRQNVANAYNLASIDASQMWQAMRDEATFAANAAENYQNRVVQLYGLAIGNETAVSGTTTSTVDLINTVTSIIDGND